MSVTSACYNIRMMTTLKNKVTPFLAVSTMAVTGIGAGAAMNIAAADTGEKTIQFYTTAYDRPDNTPRNSAEVSNHKVPTHVDAKGNEVAAGTGTYDDPITLAVGHTFDKNGNDILDYPEGTMFYDAHLQKYLIVEDTCGDGDDGSINGCHVGYTENGKKYPWVDIWVDGGTVGASKASDCMDKVTDIHPLIMNPAKDYKVTPTTTTTDKAKRIATGIADSGCQTFSDTALKADGSTTSPSTTPSTPSTTSSTKTFSVNADTQVDSSNPTTNYGSAKTLGADASPMKRTYMSFPVSGVSGKTVTSAKLRFYVTDASAHEQNIVKTSGAWSEASTTYNNRPGTANTPSVTFDDLKTGWNEISIPASDITGDGTYSYGIHPHDSGDTDGLDVASRESGNGMQLIVTTK